MVRPASSPRKASTWPLGVGGSSSKARHQRWRISDAKMTVLAALGIVTVVLITQVWQLQSSSTTRTHHLMSARLNLPHVQHTDVVRSKFSSSDHPATTRPSSLDLYSYALHPILPGVKASSNQPVPVVYFGAMQQATNNPSTDDELLEDGLHRSRYISVTKVVLWNADKHHRESISLDSTIRHNSSNDKVYWVHWTALDRDCHVLRAMMMAQRPVQPNTVVLVYWDQSGSTTAITCPHVDAMFDTVRYAQRAIVQDRYFDDATQWVAPGQVVVRPNHDVAPVLHAPLALRESLVQLLEEEEPDEKIAGSSITTRRRPQDVTFFWRKGDASHYGRLRQQVAHILLDMEKQQDIKHLLVRILGDEDALETSRSFPPPQLEYAQALQASKIVVVAQRDEWEDAGQLLEAMASEALVLVDAMVALPRGVQHKVNVIVYQDAASLRMHIIYYLQHDSERVAIAAAGRAVALGRHRMWHRVEALLWGAAATQYKLATLAAPPKMH